jgi:hypothetical protein
VEIDGILRSHGRKVMYFPYACIAFGNACNPFPTVAVPVSKPTLAVNFRGADA